MAELATPVDRGPLPEEIRFVELREGKVHVEATPPAPKPEGTVSPVPRLPDSMAIVDWVLGVLYTRCGLRARTRELGSAYQNAWITDQFGDDRLCQRCYQSVPKEDQARLFEHMHPGQWMCPHCNDWFGPEDAEDGDIPPVCTMCRKAGPE